MQNAANSVNYAEIIKYFVNRDMIETPSGIRKILGHETRIERFQTQSITLNSSMQKKVDIILPRYVLSAIDLHVKEVGFQNFKTLTELIYKLNEICENELSLVR